jgi:3-oxoacyl-[acyl-carrier protein] reductase
MSASWAYDAGVPLLAGRVAVVTGGGRGIGASVARTLAVAGAQVVVADLDAGAAEESAAQLRTLGHDALGIACDVTSEAQVSQLIAASVERYGTIDVMVNNAGITRDATMRRMTLEDFRAVIDVHLIGAWLGTRAAAGVMRDRGRGSIVNMSSISGKVGNIGQTNYSSAKAALIGLTKASAKELAHAGVRVNAIQPGLIRTPMTESMRADIWEQKMSEIPLGRAGEPDEIANTVLYLASELSSYVTGTVHEVTGGRFM